MFRRLFSSIESIKEKRKFALLRKEVEVSPSVEKSICDMNAISVGARTSKDALEEFVTILASRPEINEILYRFGWVGAGGFGGKQKLLELYHKLVLNDAGWIGKTPVALAFLQDPKLLTQILTLEAEGSDERFRISRIAWEYAEQKNHPRRFINLSWISWVYFIDVLLMMIPAIDTANIYGGLTTYVVSYLVLGILWYLDRCAIRSSWGFWRRMGLKMAFILLADALVIISAAETCSSGGTICHRIFF